MPSNLEPSYASSLILGEYFRDEERRIMLIELKELAKKLKQGKNEK